MITYTKLRETAYQVTYENGVDMGLLAQEVDGFFYWLPNNSRGGYLPSWVLLDIGKKLKKLNRKWELEMLNGLDVAYNATGI